MHSGCPAERTTRVKALRQLGPPPVRLYDLRHTHATLAIARGADIPAVARALGHTNTTQTLRTDAHVLPEQTDRLTQLVNTLDDEEVLLEVLPDEAQVLDFPQRQRKSARSQ